MFMSGEVDLSKYGIDSEEELMVALRSVGCKYTEDNFMYHGDEIERPSSSETAYLEQQTAAPRRMMHGSNGGRLVKRGTVSREFILPNLHNGLRNYM